ncbi:MAG: protein translocase subunit SecD [Nocardioidaceae bacterium]|nr:protein translocase subunit SecD [Nocardioidaceae bacterium]
MPTPRPSPGSSHARPGRVLAAFMVVVVALFAAVALIGTWKPALGLDLQGGTRITLQAKSSEGDVDPVKLEQARDIIDQRVNGTGVSEAEVTTQGGDQVIIEIPGRQEQGIVDEVGRTAQLRFRLVWATGQPPATAPSAATVKADAAAAQKAVAAVDWTKLSLAQQITGETKGVTSLGADYQPAIAALQKQAASFPCTRAGLGTVQDEPDQPIVTCEPDSGAAYVLSPAVIEGTDVGKVTAGVPQGQFEWGVNLALKNDAKDAFKDVTTALTQQNSQFAIVLDGEVLAAPTSQAAISNGESRISGGFTQTSAQSLANSLRFGALPLSFGVNGVEVEGPSLAGAQLQAGLIAGALGLALVVVYSVAYYRRLGLVVVGSLGIAAAITYALVLLLGAGAGFTLTLPGIAGLIVAIGITADSFIVYFERIRDEMRHGRSARVAVETAWVRARRTILAADAVSFLAALVLFIFAIGVVRGFAFALGLTTLIDIAVVFGFTKPLVSLMARRGWVKVAGAEQDPDPADAPAAPVPEGVLR